VGLLAWAQHESLAAPRFKKGRRNGNGNGSRLRNMDLSKGMDLLKRLLP